MEEQKTSKQLREDLAEAHRRIKELEESAFRLKNQLAQSQKMEALGTLSGGIAHDFNNILTPIIGFTELAMDICGQNEELQEDLHEILSAAQRAKVLVNQILTYSRQGMIEPKPINARYIIKEALKLLAASIPKTITISSKITSKSMIMADPTHIHQILINLCANAAHAMRDCGGTLEVKLEDTEMDGASAALYPDASPGNYVTLTVSDTGHGMTEDVREKIFDPYFTTKETGAGTGLGLFVVHGIVMKYHGFITVNSSPGKGSMFRIFFPLLEQESNSLIMVDEASPIGQRSILVIDDEEPIVNYLKRSLELLGYRVTTRIDSREAFELFKTDPYIFDLVIADMIMPGMTGDRLAKELINIRKDIPVILSTGHNGNITEEEALKMGIKGYFLKPILKKDLADLIRNVFDSSNENTGNALN